MKPHTYRVHHDGTYTDFAYRRDANACAMMRRAQGCKNVRVQSIGY